MRYPAYFEAFRCAADQCGDSCCRTWEIDIDRESLARYRACTGALGDRLRRAIAEENGEAHFLLTEDKRCPFLNEQGLCDLYIELGEDALCQICRDHPRFYFSLGETEYAGLGLCCEAAAELILSPDCDLRMTGDAQTALSGPEAVFYERWLGFLRHADELSGALLSDGESSLRALLDLLLTLEINSSAWPALLTEARERLPELLRRRSEFLRAYPAAVREYGALTRYFIYRHLPGALLFEDLAEGLAAEFRLVACGVRVISLLNVLVWLRKGTFSLADQISVCKLYSQEIEYDDTNPGIIEETPL